MAIQFLKTAVIPHGVAPADEVRALEMVEVCGRTAYKSEDKITPDSAKSFVLMLKKHNHLSVLEHSNIVLKFEGSPRGSRSDVSSTGEICELLLKCLKERNAYHRIYQLSESHPDGFAVAGNFRSWIETIKCLKEDNPAISRLLEHHLNRFFPNLFPLKSEEPVEFPYSASLMKEDEQVDILRKNPHCDLPVFIFKFVCDRGITHEVVRHRVLSFTQESTRYVNYKNKGMALIVPEELEPLFDDASGRIRAGNALADKWLERAEILFSWYQEDIGRGLKPEIARDILPNLVKSEIFVSGRWSGWKHFVNLRDSKQAHPRIRLIAAEVRKYFESVGLTLE